ncbi:MAG TPA: GNAT family N-acetyltransferase [Chitinophagaceae bacterium]|nr:GNAT family N-acetyltransferase [Chitinophagaceae bacterium]
MRIANNTDRELVVNILSASFETNKSVNYIIKQDVKRRLRISRLMEYSFDTCYSFGKVFLSDDGQACALILLPDKRKTTFRTILNDLKLIFTCTGLGNALKALRRETKIKSFQPQDPIYYLWFIGVIPEAQGRGIGSKLMKELLAECGFHNRTICLETSSTRNLHWYEQFGFSIYNKLDLGYKLFFLKKD